MMLYAHHVKGKPFVPAPTIEGWYGYRDPGSSYLHLVEADSRGAIFTDAEGNGERLVQLADLRGEWCGPLEGVGP